MNPYRKPDQQYYDDYDRSTIKILKEIEEKEKKEYPKTVMVKGEARTISRPIINNFRDKAILMSRRREEYVKERIREDEEKDRMVQSYKAPEGLKCDTCNTRMALSGHAFNFRGYKFLFLFDCPRGKHKSRKIIHPDGDELFFQVSRCKLCGGEITSRTEEIGFLTKITDTCKTCKNETVLDFDMTPEPPITDEDRQKYCLQYKGHSTFMEDLEKINNFTKYLDEHEAEKLEKEKYEIDKIEKLIIPKLKERLIKVTQEAGYIDFEISKPDMGRFVVIEFNVQDPKDISSKESVKVLCKEINNVLSGTNWQLQNSSVVYRMGYLTGKLKGCEDDEGLIELAKKRSK